MDFEFLSDPYSIYDSGINPKYFLWEKYKKPVSRVNDERSFSKNALKLLNDHATLIEASKQIDAVGGKKDDDGIPRRVFEDFYGHGSNALLYLYKDNMVSISDKDDGHYSIVSYHPIDKPSVHDEFERFVIQTKGESQVSILIERRGGLVAQTVSFPPPIIKDLKLNYGTGFQEVHDKIINNLEERRNGIHIYHGVSGSGKSTFIKYLTSVVDREFIFIPIAMANRLASAEFLSLLMGKKEAVLILEDAEGAIRARGTEGSDESTVSTLLNISDGILGNLLNLCIIVSYNCDKQLIDKALLRKGRLSIDHSFDALSVDDARRLAESLGKKIDIRNPMTLADIYNAEQDTGYVPEVVRPVGFHATLKT